MAHFQKWSNGYCVRNIIMKEKGSGTRIPLNGLRKIVLLDKYGI